jgi:hypothetical protein
MLAGGTAPVGPGPNPNPPVTQPLTLPVATALWSVSRAAGSVNLSYGDPSSPGAEFAASCPNGSGQATVTLGPTFPGLQPGTSVQVTATAGTFVRTYNAVGSPFNPSIGGSQAQVSLSMADPLWPAIITESDLLISVSSMSPQDISLRGSAAPTKQFLASCSPQPVVSNPPTVFGPNPPPAFGPTPPATVGGLVYSCDDGSEISIAWNRGNGTATVREPSFPPRTLPRVDSDEAGVDTWGAGPFRLDGRDEQVTWWRPGVEQRICMLQ